MIDAILHGTLWTAVEDHDLTDDGQPMACAFVHAWDFLRGEHFVNVVAVEEVRTAMLALTPGDPVTIIGSLTQTTRTYEGRDGIIRPHLGIAAMEIKRGHLYRRTEADKQTAAQPRVEAARTTGEAWEGDEGAEATVKRRYPMLH